VARWPGGLALMALPFFFNYYALRLLPDERIPIPAARIEPLSEAKATFAWVYRLDQRDWSAAPTEDAGVTLSEDGAPLCCTTSSTREVRILGAGRWSQQPGRLVFSTTDNSDPRTNGRRYALHRPVPESQARLLGRLGGVAFVAFTCAAWLLNRRRPAPLVLSPTRPIAWRWHLGAATAVFLAGLYCNTGTLAPYANTYPPYVEKATGYLFSTDHEHFRVLFDFVDGKSRAVWDHAILLRRILYPVLAWPFMKLGGFEAGGVVFSLLANVAVFIFAAFELRRHLGERGATFAMWLLALYPGAAYWGGLPYPYALIFPASLLLMLLLIRLSKAEGRATIWISLAMGALYLSYDLTAFFLPATLLTMAWRRRFAAGLLSAAVQLLPVALWMLALVVVFEQPLGNRNTVIYSVVAGSYLHPGDLGAWWALLSKVPDVAGSVYFGANFLFLPALFLVILAVNPTSSRVRFEPEEAALLVTGLALFCFCNLAPPYEGWSMRGTWIARLYQPVFPALVIFAARWWSGLPALGRGMRAVVCGSLVAAASGNALIVFGPILNNPLKVSETAFYSFYNHFGDHGIYEQLLREYGRRPLGFPRPQE
jgi:hypothetical protein